MKKFLRWILIACSSLLIICVVVVGGIWLYLKYQVPSNSGEERLTGIQEVVEVYTDQYGIPHIYAQSQKDAYRTLGFLHARERLFQMEMIRRATTGKLSEILGEDFVEIDKFFLTLGIKKKAIQTYQELWMGDTLEYQHAALAYLDGINQFIQKGPLPVEFKLLGIEAHPFSVEDFYHTAGYMAFSFAHAFRADPLIETMYRQFGDSLMQDLAVHWPEDGLKIAVNNGAEIKANLKTSGISFPENKDCIGEVSNISFAFNQLLSKLPLPLLEGSNSWIIAPEKSESGKVIFANDTHIGFSQPSVWFEAHLEYPGQSLYGNFLAGFPFMVVGHSRSHAIGMTMFENDDIDFFQEVLHPENPDKYLYNGNYQKFSFEEAYIKVKGKNEPVKLMIRSTEHGPVINDAVKTFEKITSDPISIFWTFTATPSRQLEACYKMAHAKNINDVEKGAAMITAPGLNIMYGDVDGNIAWWASGSMLNRPEHVNSKRLLNGAETKDKPTGFYPFDYNPRNINPQEGFIYSANNQPEATEAGLHPGYYLTDARARRINELLSTPGKKWSIDDMKVMINDSQSTLAINNVASISQILAQHYGGKVPHSNVYDVLRRWPGTHELEETAPLIYYRLLYEVLYECFFERMGNENFETLLGTHMVNRSIPNLLENDSSKWWDSPSTAKIETRGERIALAWDRTVSWLQREWGSDIKQWQWKNAHQVVHEHALGKQKPLDKIFNVGPFPVNGGMEVINNLNFKYADKKVYTAHSGPAMRTLIDFADVENSLSILPTGQSGHVLSPHYDDQAEMYNSGKFRKQMMNEKEIKSTSLGVLRIIPQGIDK